MLTTCSSASADPALDCAAFASPRPGESLHRVERGLQLYTAVQPLVLPLFLLLLLHLSLVSLAQH